MKSRDRVRIEVDGKLETISVRQLRADAAAGDPESECTLGFLHARGRGVRKSPKRAAHYYARAARQGHAIAACNLATCYLVGRGVKVDLRKAFSLFRKAASKGDVQAQCDLGLMYRFAEGVEYDRKLALHWLLRAARSGEVRALYNIGDGWAIAGDFVKARRYMERAAALGYRDAKRWLTKKRVRNRSSSAPTPGSARRRAGSRGAKKSRRPRVSMTAS